MENIELTPIASELPTYTHYINADYTLLEQWCEQQWGKHGVDWHMVSIADNMCIVTVWDSKHSMWLRLKWEQARLVARK